MTLPDQPWPAPAKLNLFLHVVGRRADGYHLLQTLFQFVDHCDEIAVEPTDEPAIIRLSDLPGVPPQADLVIRAAIALQQATGCRFGARIRVDKRLPVGGGLGGGSSNAATVLVALNELWDTHLSEAALSELGLKLGADVPVFVQGKAAWAEGVGEQLTPVEVPEPWYLVIHPGCQVPTAAVFSAPELTRNTPVSTIHDLSRVQQRNDCEPVTRRLFPEVGKALDWLGQFATARMTGTGACVFAEFASASSAATVAAQVPSTWQWFVGAGRNRSPLQARLAQARAKN